MVYQGNTFIVQATFNFHVTEPEKSFLRILENTPFFDGALICLSEQYEMYFWKTSSTAEIPAGSSATLANSQEN